MTSRRWLVLVGLAVLGVAIWLWPANQSGEAPAATTTEAAPDTTIRSRPPPTLPGKPAFSPPARIAAPPFDASTQHTVDPCTATTEAEIPTGFMASRT